MNAESAPRRRRRPDISALATFVHHEARLIDEQKWEAWNDLFTEDGVYWMPASPGQPDATHHVSLIHENALLRAVRIKRFRHPNAFSLQPRPRTVHVSGNVMLDEFDEASGDCVVSSTFIVLHYRREQQDVLGGRCTHHLKRVKGGFRIRLKKVELVNCDAPMGNILVYL